MTTRRGLFGLLAGAAAAPLVPAPRYADGGFALTVALVGERAPEMIMPARIAAQLARRWEVDHPNCRCQLIAERDPGPMRVIDSWATYPEPGPPMLRAEIA